MCLDFASYEELYQLKVFACPAHIRTSNSLYRTCRHSPHGLGFGMGDGIHQLALHEAYLSSTGEYIFANLKQSLIEVLDLKMNFLAAFIY